MIKTAVPNVLHIYFHQYTETTVFISLIGRSIVTPMSRLMRQSNPINQHTTKQVKTHYLQNCRRVSFFIINSHNPNTYFNPIRPLSFVVWYNAPPLLFQRTSEPKNLRMQYAISLFITLYSTHRKHPCYDKFTTMLMWS